MSDYLVYGKIIVDDVKLADGTLARSVLGGGGPQSAFGARLWDSSVGFLSRIGFDMKEEHMEDLKRLDINLEGLHRYDTIPTPHSLMQYDENEYAIPAGVQTSREDWDRLLAQVLVLPKPYQKAKGIHLVTEFPEEPMVRTALELRQKGAIFSVEPIISQVSFVNAEGMLRLFREVDCVSPDWPSASGIADSDDPLTVLKHWATLGPQMVVVRHGVNGSYAWDQHHDEMWHIPAVVVPAIDPTGAGNSYSGGQFVGWATTRDAREAGCCGAVSASFMVERIGLPTVVPEIFQEAGERLAQALDLCKKL